VPDMTEQSNKPDPIDPQSALNGNASAAHDAEPAQQPPAGNKAKRKRKLAAGALGVVVLAALLVVAGTLLLLPGLCTESFWHIELHKPNVPLSRPAVIIFAIEFAGAALILAGIVTAIVWLAPRQRSVFAKAFLVLASLIVALFGLTLILTVVMR